MKNESKKERKKETSKIKWFFIVAGLSFVLSIIFSFISTVAISKLSIIPAIFLLLLVILIGILFDIIGVAVTVAKESDFHAMASKKISGAKTSIKLIKNSGKVANVCADVIGDIAGVLSGAISALITLKITEKFNMEFNIQFILSAIVASLTIGGKALGKEIAQKNSTKIIASVGKILKVFGNENNKNK